LATRDCEDEDNRRGKSSAVDLDRSDDGQHLNAFREFHMFGVPLARTVHRRDVRTTEFDPCVGARCENSAMARYYGIDEANSRLLELRPMLERLRSDRDRVAEVQRELKKGRESNGSAEHAEQLAEMDDELREVVRRMQTTVGQIDAWGVTLRDIGTGLIDFPALAMGRPIWLCWRLGEDDHIAWWHEVTSGFDSRQPLSELT
jgi:hypothetical protein